MQPAPRPSVGGASDARVGGRITSAVACRGSIQRPRQGLLAFPLPVRLPYDGWNSDPLAVTALFVYTQMTDLEHRP